MNNNDVIEEAFTEFFTEQEIIGQELADLFEQNVGVPRAIGFALFEEIINEDLSMTKGEILEVMARIVNESLEDRRVIVSWSQEGDGGSAFYKMAVIDNRNLSEAEKKRNHEPDHYHLHVVYSKGTWGKREWQYRNYSIKADKLHHTAARSSPTALHHGVVNDHHRTNTHHRNLLKQGWHVEHRVVAHPDDSDKTQGELNRKIKQHAETDASIRKSMKDKESPPKPAAGKKK